MRGSICLRLASAGNSSVMRVNGEPGSGSSEVELDFGEDIEGIAFESGEVEDVEAAGIERFV